MGRFPVGRDIAERVLATFVMTVLGLATADGINWTDWGSLDNWQTWGVGGLTAGFSLLKGLIASRISKRQGRSASLDPGVKLQPVSEHASA
jgi:hypothetical protein